MSTYSIQRFDEIVQAFKDVGGVESGIKLSGSDYFIHIDYSNAPKKRKQQFKRALFKHTIKNKGKNVLKVCFILAMMGAWLKGCHAGLNYLTFPYKTKIKNENGLLNIQKITDQQKLPPQDISRGARTE